MLSHNNTFDHRDCGALPAVREDDQEPIHGFVTELKIDSLAVTLFYEEGSSSESTGDGFTGNITANLRTIRVSP